MAIHADFCNNSSGKITPEAVLCQKLTFRAGSRSKVQKTKFTVVSGDSIASGQKSTWKAKLLKIPPLTPSIHNCDLIELRYTVKVSSHSGGKLELLYTTF